MSSIDTGLRILCVVGARPHFMKIAPIVRAFRACGSGLEPVLLHTGQHYDAAMKAAFFDQPGISGPRVAPGGFAIHACVADIPDNGGKRGRVPGLWDGHAVERIAAVIARTPGPGGSGHA